MRCADAVVGFDPTITPFQNALGVVPLPPVVRKSSNTCKAPPLPQPQQCVIRACLPSPVSVYLAWPLLGCCLFRCVCLFVVGCCVCLAVCGILSRSAAPTLRAPVVPRACISLMWKIYVAAGLYTLISCAPTAAPLERLHHICTLLKRLLHKVHC